mmetsp:Transcript_85420/g.226829  ORF Transcript_85420/g.226829 Transcript_85420/m.226829 type:complete len:231 (-) Transcript_85420:234-926(-)
MKATPPPSRRLLWRFFLSIRECKASETVSKCSFTLRWTPLGMSARQSGHRRIPPLGAEAGSLMKQPLHRLCPHGSPKGLRSSPRQHGHCKAASSGTPSQSSPRSPSRRNSRHCGPVSKREQLTLAAPVSWGIRSPKQTARTYFLMWMPPVSSISSPTSGSAASCCAKLSVSRSERTSLQVSPSARPGCTRPGLRLIPTACGTGISTPAPAKRHSSPPDALGMTKTGARLR